MDFLTEIQASKGGHLDCSGALPGGITDSLFILTITAVFPIVKIIQIEKAVRNVSLNLAGVINDTTSALDGIQMSLNSLPWAVVDDYIALSFLFASHGGVCAIASTSWIN